MGRHANIFPNMNEAIARSHARSRAYGVSPNLKGAPEESRLSDEALARRIADEQEFYDLGRAQLDILFRLLAGTGFCMALADAEGYVLYVVGDPHLIEHFRRRRCLPGYRWTERDVGTCAIGMALADGQPVFIPGNRMYSVLVPNISNSAAPVFAPDGRTILGAISLSSESHRIHIHTLGLVRQAAEVVTVQMLERQRTRELAIGRQYLHSIMDSTSHGMVAVNSDGLIMASNLRGRQLLDLPGQCEGLPLDRYLHSGELDACIVRGTSLTARELPTCAGTTHFISFEPIHLQGEVVGGLVSIQEKRDVMRMAVKVSGNVASFTFESILGEDAGLQQAVKLARIAATSSAPVLIVGETGTGKELFAQSIHNASARADQPFVALNCSAIPKELMESELFGYEEGAFTGARKGGKPGKLELASGGTLFLDEIGDMPLDMQVKLLRVLQSGTNQRVGGMRSEPVDLRIIAATNVDLPQAISAHKFRQDLFYRISTFVVAIPPLRERGQDSLILAEHFMARHALTLGRPSASLSPEARAAILAGPWPGNIRQLENAVERAMYLAEDGLLRPEHFSPGQTGTSRAEDGNTACSVRKAVEGGLTLAEFEQEFIREVLKACKGNMSECAARLGISRPTLYRKLSRC